MNNYDCNFDSYVKYVPGDGGNWNSIGTGEFSFFDTMVYGAVGKDGKFTESDPHNVFLGNEYQV